MKNPDLVYILRSVELKGAKDCQLLFVASFDFDECLPSIKLIDG